MTELLFLYECATAEPTQLRPVAASLGLTVQATSHSFRQLRGRGLVEVRDGRYRPTVDGVAWLHEMLAAVGDDVRARIARLHVIRSTRAVALRRLAAGAPVSLELDDGMLSARPGADGASRGTVAAPAEAGELVEVTNLEGIVPLEPVTISVRTLGVPDLKDPALARAIAAALPDGPGLLAAEGLEAFHSVRRATDRPVVRFAPAAACAEAARLGVPSTLFVLENDLPRVLASFAGPAPPPFEVLPVRRGRRGVPRRGRAEDRA